MQKIYSGFNVRNTCLPVLLACFLQLVLTDAAQAEQQRPFGLNSTKRLEQKRQRIAKTLKVADARFTTHRLAASTISRPLTSTEYEPEGTGWRQTSTFSYTYDNMGRITEEAGQNSQGTNTYKYTLSYSQEGHNTGFVYYRWEGGNWVIQYGYQTTITYDSNGRLSEVTESEWEEGTWKLSWRTTLTYNSSGDLTEVTDYSREGTAWEADGNTTYTYTAPNTAPTAIIYSETNEAGTMEPYEHITNIVWREFTAGDINSYFNEEDWWTSAIEQEWVDGNWVNESKWTATFGENDSYVGIDQEWKNGAWVNNWRYTKTLDAHGNVLLNQDEEWENGAWDIQYGSKTRYTFNASNQVTEMIEEMWNDQASRYEPMLRIVYSNFQTITSASKEVAALLTEAYPNPTADNITVRFAQSATQATLTVTDLTGKTVLTKQLKPTTTQQELDLANIPSGLYLLQLHTGDAVATRKIIKQ